MFDWSWTMEIFASLLTLTALKVVLGIDNLIFCRWPGKACRNGARARARRLGLIGALVPHIALLVMPGPGYRTSRGRLRPSAR